MKEWYTISPEHDGLKRGQHFLYGFSANGKIVTLIDTGVFQRIYWHFIPVVELLSSNNEMVTLYSHDLEKTYLIQQTAFCKYFHKCYLNSNKIWSEVNE